MHWRRPALLAPLLVLAACRSGGSAGPGAAVPDPPATTTAPAAGVEHDVEVAYLHSWDVYAKALRTLSTDGLDESFTGAALDSTIAEVNRLRAAGTPVRMEVEHQLTVTPRSSIDATVTDTYRNHAVLLDKGTGAPIEPDPNNFLLFSYELRKVNSRWLITFVTRH